MLTTATARKSQKLWPSLSSSDVPSTSSFFGDQKIVQGSKWSQPPTVVPEVDEEDADEVDCRVPAYKNQLGDCLANALAKSVSLKETPKSKKKKAKKTLLFASGMNFN